MAIPDDIAAFAQNEAARQGVDPSLVMQVLNTEGGGYGNTSPKGAMGPMQLMPGTAHDLGVDPTDWRQNVTGGVRYLKQQLDAFGGDPKLALAAYNAGPGAVRRYGGVPPYKQTQAYVASEDMPSAADLFGGGANQGQSQGQPAQQPQASTALQSDADSTPTASDLFSQRSGRVFVKVKDASGNAAGVSPASAAQEAYWLKGMNAGQLNPSAPEGSENNPVTIMGGNVPTKPGTHYVTESGLHGVVGSAPPPVTAPGATYFSDGQAVPDAQRQAYLRMIDSGQMDPSKPLGDPRRPYVYRPDAPPPVGASYIDLDGTIKVASAPVQTGAMMPLEQAYALSQLQGAGRLDPSKPLGDKAHPVAYTPGDQFPQAGAYYVDQMGRLNRSNGGNSADLAYDARMAKKYGQVQWADASADASRARTAAEQTGPGAGGRAYANGGAMGWFPELMAYPAGWAVDAQNTAAKLGLGQARPYSGDAYRDAIITGEHQGQNQFAREHPVENLTLGALGSIPTTEALGLGKFIGGAKTATGLAARSAAAGGAMGAANGAGQDYTDRGAGAASGGAWGTVVGAAAPWLTQKAAGAAAAAARPVVEAASKLTGGRLPTIPAPTLLPQNARQQLASQGVPLTPGQLAGGPAAKVEDTLAKLPGLNFVVGRAQSRAVGGWNVATANKVLEPIGATLPKGTAPGRPMIQALEGRIGQEYDGILSKVPGVNRDAAFDADIQNLRNSGQLMFKDDADRLENVIDNGVNRAFDPKTGFLDANGWKAVDTRLGQMAAKTRQTNPEFADGVTALQGAWRDLLERSNPQQAAALDRANQAWAAFKRVQKAALAAGKDEEPGVFTPQQLQRAAIALDRSKDKAAAARGGALMQDWADQGAKVLGGAAPPSAGGGSVVGGALAGLAGAAASGHLHVPLPAAAGGAAAAALYSPPVKALVRGAFGRGVNPAALSTMRNVAPAAPGVAGTVGPQLPRLGPIVPGRKAPAPDTSGPIYVSGG